MTPAKEPESDRALATAAASAAAAARPASRQEQDRELDHRLANSLQLAADFLIFEHIRVGDPRARTALIETAERLSAVGQIHRFLATRHRAGGIDLDPFLREFARLIGEATGLDCSVDAEPAIVEAETAQQLAIAVNELAMNAAKHAYPWGERGPLSITCHRRGEQLEIGVADAGEGLAPGFTVDRSNGLGMSILQAIARQLRGTLAATNDGGARFTLTVPLRSAAEPASRSFAPEIHPKRGP